MQTIGDAGLTVAEPQNGELKTYLMGLFEIDEDTAREAALDIELIIAGDTTSTRFYEGR